MTPSSELGLFARPAAAKMAIVVDWPKLRARCRQRVDDLLGHTGIPDPWDVNEFLDRLERHRRRDIDLCAITWSPGNSCGAWQQHPDHDVIAYAENTSGFHQDHIILHEVGHMISSTAVAASYPRNRPSASPPTSRQLRWRTCSTAAALRPRNRKRRRSRY